MKISNTVKYFGLLFLALMAIGFVIHKTGYTFQVVDQIYCRGHLPWAAEQTVERCGVRSGDDLFENDFIETELQYLADNPHQQTYSERVMNGYSIRDAYSANTITFFHLFSQFLPTTSSIIFSSLITLFISFTLGYAIGRSLSFDNKFSLLFGLLSLTPAYVGLFESWNLALIAYGLLFLGLIRFYRYEERRLFVLFSFVGASLIILSSIYQFYLYAIINVAFLAIVYFTGEAPKDKKRILLIFIIIVGAFLSAALVWNVSLFRHLAYLKDSNKVGLQVSFPDLIRRKGYALDPLGWVGSEPVIVHRAILHRLLPAPIFKQLQSFQSGYDSPGVGYILLMFVGLVYLWKRRSFYRAYVVLILFWFLYFTGPLQLLLSVTIGGPFKNETSVRGSYLFFLFGSFAVLYALREQRAGSLQLSKKLKRGLWFFSGYVLFISLVLAVVDFFKEETFSDAPFVVLAAAFFLLGLWYWQKNKTALAQRYLTASVLLPTLAHLFFGATLAVFSLQPSKLYFPETLFSQALKHHPDIERIVLVQTPTGGVIHPNTAIQLGRASVSAYRNPTNKYYLEFFKYHEFLVNGIKNTDEAFVQFRSSIMYQKNDVGPLALSDNEFYMSNASRLYFDLLAVDGLITSQNFLLQDADWEKVFSGDKLSLWRRLNEPPSFFFATHTLVMDKDLDRLAYIFENESFNPRQDVVLAEAVTLANTNQNGATHKIILHEARDGYRRFAVDTDQSGVLTIPAVYHSRWTARWFGSDGSIQDLQTVRSNYAFLGVVVPAGSGELKLIYDEKPETWQYGLIWFGLFFAGSLFMWKDKHSNQSV